MDPQQRLLLELAWEALEHAGLAPTSLAGAAAGVYLGIANGDYGRALVQPSGAHRSVLQPGQCLQRRRRTRRRTSSACKGPAIAIDTACSSSLVALHLACQGLRHGDCDLALAGGVNLILTPELNVNFCKAGDDVARRTLPDVRRGGQRLRTRRRRRRHRAAAAARRDGDGDRILAVVRGSAINQDGRSNGLTAPNGPAQQAVIRARARGRGDAAAPRRLRRGAWHRHAARRPDRGRCAGRGALAKAATRASHAGARIGQDEHRAPRGGGGNRRRDQDGARARSGARSRRTCTCRRRTRYIDWKALPITIPDAVDAMDGRSRAGTSPASARSASAARTRTSILEAAPAPSEAEATGRARAEQLLALSARDPQALARSRAPISGPARGLARRTAGIAARHLCHRQRRTDAFRAPCLP